MKIEGKRLFFWTGNWIGGGSKKKELVVFKDKESTFAFPPPPPPPRNPTSASKGVPFSAQNSH